MGPAHFISTLLYVFNSQDEILLLQRALQPNRGLWSPCGGKVSTAQGESPHACAVREAREEMGLEITPADLHLTGLVAERGAADAAHWLMFLFEIKPRLEQAPPPHREGIFRFFPRNALDTLAVPPTDSEKIWPLFWAHRGGFFAASCDASSPARGRRWSVEESIISHA